MSKIEQLEVDRLSLVTKTDSTLQICEEISRGCESTVFECTKGQQSYALKINRMIDGMRREFEAFVGLSGVTGIPVMYEHYTDGKTVIGMLLERINGEPFDDYLLKNPHQIGDAFTNLRALIRSIHSRGFLLPDDWMKKGNILLPDSLVTQLVDLGEANLAHTSNEVAVHQRAADLRSFHEWIDRYRANSRRNIRRQLDGILYQDYLAAR